MFKKLQSIHNSAEVLTINIVPMVYRSRSLYFSYLSSLHKYDDTIFRFISKEEKVVFSFRMDQTCSSIIITPITLNDFHRIIALRNEENFDESWASSPPFPMNLYLYESILSRKK
jgi:hypothetical protein|uniref:Uncharacterized protein n=1 Tax=viral metagenome TaxID=1070528 RepID=A0A6C0IWW6_9ZZZZ